MSTIIRDKKQIIVSHIVLLIILFISYRYITPCPNCICQQQECPNCICQQQECPNCICPSHQSKMINSTDVCLEIKPDKITIHACYSIKKSNSRIININNITLINRDYLDTLYVNRQPLLIIEIPVNIDFDNSYKVVSSS